MRFGFFYIDSYYLYLVVPAILLAVIASYNVNATFARYNKYTNKRGYTGAQVAKMILNEHGLNINVQFVPGKLTDHYDPKANVIKLSESVYNSRSIGSIGVAAHEVGHAIQYSQGYAPIKLRASIIPVTQFGSTLSMPLIFIGFLAQNQFMIMSGIILFSTVCFFQLVTLPVEFNASKRAIAIISEKNILDGEEIEGAKKVLNAAAMTYVASLLVSLANLIRLILLSNNRSNNDR